MKNKKSIVLIFNMDNEFDRELYNSLSNLKDVGISRQGMMKRIFYKALIEDKTDEEKPPVQEAKKNKELNSFFEELEKN